MVCKLYGLTKEEIAIVEGHNSTNGRDNQHPHRLANKIKGSSNDWRK